MTPMAIGRDVPFMSDSRTVRFDVAEVIYDWWCDLRDRYGGDHRHLAAAVVLDPPDEQVHIAAQGADDLSAFVEDGGAEPEFSATDQATAVHLDALEARLASDPKSVDEENEPAVSGDGREDQKTAKYVTDENRFEARMSQLDWSQKPRTRSRGSTAV